jgi:hypothetical protein
MSSRKGDEGISKVAVALHPFDVLNDYNAPERFFARCTFSKREEGLDKKLVEYATNMSLPDLPEATRLDLAKSHTRDPKLDR